MGELELDCLSVITPDQIASWAVVALQLPADDALVSRVSVTGMFGSRTVPDLDELTNVVYHHVGNSGQCYTVRIRRSWAMSRALRVVLDDERGWRRVFGSGLPHDYG